MARPRVRRLAKPVERLAVYENIHALNRDFEQVLADLARLQELGVFQRDRFTVFRLIVQETRAWANVAVVEVLKQREEDDWVNFGQMRDQWATRFGRSQAVERAAAEIGRKERPAQAARGWIEGRMSGNYNFLHGFVAGLCIIGKLAPLRNPPGHPPATEQDHWAVQGSCPPGQTLENRARIRTGPAMAAPWPGQQFLLMLARAIGQR
jgi:hypothetical protein